MKRAEERMSQLATIILVSAFALINIGLCWIDDWGQRFMLRCLVNLAMVITSGIAWRAIVVYTAKQIANAEPVIAAVLAHLD